MLFMGCFLTRFLHEKVKIQQFRHDEKYRQNDCKARIYAV